MLLPNHNVKNNESLIHKTVMHKINRLSNGIRFFLIIIFKVFISGEFILFIFLLNVTSI